MAAVGRGRKPSKTTRVRRVLNLSGLKHPLDPVDSHPHGALSRAMEQPNGEAERGESPPPELPEPQRPLDSRVLETARELAELDVQLEALFLLGHELLPRVGEPGVAYVVAQVGRELSRGVIRVLEAIHGDASSSLDTQEDADEDSSQENNKPRIAAALELDVQDPRVGAWARVVRDFAGWMKYRSPPPDPSAVRDGFQVLSDLLFGRVAPYFSTQTALDGFLGIEAPDERDAAQLPTYLLRLSQRRYFFANLQGVAWAEPLEERGLLDPPADPAPDEDGIRPPVAWPEGDYLIRIAEDAPDLVLRVLERVDSGCVNTFVRRVIVECALKMPDEHKARSVRLLCDGLETASDPLLSNLCGKVALQLADSDPRAGLELLSHLLFVPREAPEGAELQFGNQGWLLPRIRVEWSEDLFDEVIPAFISSAPMRAFDLLLRKWHRVLAVLTAEASHWNYRAGRMSFEVGRYDRGAPENLLAALAKAAASAAAQGEEECRTVLEALSEQEGLVFRRLRFHVLTQAGAVVPDELERALLSNDAVDPPFPAREVAAFLRRWFSHVPTAARLIYREGLERGPDLETLAANLRARSAGDPTRADIDEVRRTWHRERIRWFRGEIPAELEDLARQVGELGTVPTLEEQELAEVGWYGGGSAAVWVGSVSPIDLATLASLPPREALDFISSWTPEDQGLDAPSKRGLYEVIARLGLEHPERAADVLAACRQRDLQDYYLEGLLDGIARTEFTDRVHWNHVAALLVPLLSQPRGEDQASRALIRTAGRLLSNAGRHDGLNAAGFQDAWRAVDALLEQPGLWVEDEVADADLEKALMLSLNTPAGELTGAVVSLALSEYRLAQSDTLEAAEERSSTLAPRLTLRLDQLRSAPRERVIPVEARIGEMLPQLYLLAPTWLEEQAESLFEGGAVKPGRHPTWGAYVTRGRFFDTVFQAVASAYAQAAAQADESPESGRFSIREALARHLLIAYLRDLISLEDGSLISIGFDNLPAAALTNAYWSLFRSWSDGEQPPDDSVVARLLSFWKWRLDGISEREDGEEEAVGLTWLLLTPHLPSGDLLRLGVETVRASAGRLASPFPWASARAWASHAPQACLEIVDAVVRDQLGREYPIIAADELKDVLGDLLEHQDKEVTERVVRLVHLLGERGYTGFGELL